MKLVLDVCWSVLLVALLMGCGPRQPTQEEKAPQTVEVTQGPCPDPVAEENVRLTSALGESNSPVVVWTSEGFQVAWWDMRGRYPSVHTVLVNREGESAGEPLNMDHVGVSRQQTLAADAEQAHLVWLDEENVMSRRFGAGESASVKVATESKSPAAGPWGAVAWVDKGMLNFRCDGMLPPPDAEGNRPPPPPAVLHRGGIESPAMAWSGQHYAVAWSSSVKGGRQIMLQRVANGGQLVGNPVKVSSTGGISRNPVVIWTGKEFAVAWTNAAPEGDNPMDRYRIFLAMVPALGDAPRATRQLEFNGSADQVSLASTGEELAVSWVGSSPGGGSAVFFQRLDMAGQKLGETLKVSDEKPLACGRPTLAWAGDGYGIVWHDDREQAGSEIFFSFLRCGDPATALTDTGGVDAGVTDAADGGATTVPTTPTDVPVLKEIF